MVGQPFHIHDVQFYILDRNGSAPSENEQGRKDVVWISQMETVRFIAKFEDHADDQVPYMYHCHMLQHEDDGLMGQFIVEGEEEVLTGDVNGDEIVNILDVIETVNIVLAEEYDESADINDDGGVNILDIVAVVNIILGGGDRISSANNQATLIGNELAISGSIGGVQLKGRLVSELDGDDTFLSKNGNKVIWNMNGKLDTESFTFDSSPTDVMVSSSSGKEVSVNMVNKFTLNGNYPNPFNPETTISYSLDADSEVRLGIYNVSGQQIDELIHTNQNAGNYKVNWNASNHTSGMYIVKLSNGTNIFNHKILLIK